MNLFIYCEWLDSRLVYKSLPDAKFAGKATVKDYRVAFSSFTEDVSDEMLYGGCHLEPAEGQTLYGLLYAISDEELAKLDKLTRVEQGRYVKKHLTVADEKGKLRAAVAHSIKNPRGKSRPTQDYMDHMIQGAKEHSFPHSYIELLERLRDL
jgi:gamma-glutamylcyclotransferase